MNNREEKEKEKMACLFLLKQAKNKGDLEKAFALAIRIKEIEAKL